MPNKFNSSINNHSFPKAFFLFPVLLKVYFFINFITTLRNWHIKKFLGKITSKTKNKFLFYDAGCGSGDFILSLSKKNKDSSFVGADIHNGNIDVCTNYAEKLNLKNISFVKQYIEHFNLKTPADIITCFTVLQYIEDDVSVLNLFSRSLKKDGILLVYVPVNYVVSIPLLRNLRNRYFSKLEYDAVNNIKRRYSRADILQKLEYCGFETFEVKNTYGFAGRAAYEIHSFFLLAFQKVNLFLAFFILLFYIPCVFPFFLLLNLFDFCFSHKEGNGLLISCRKTTELTLKNQ